MEKNEILKILRTYPQSIERYETDFRIICNSVHINEFCFRDANIINICNDTLWIDGVSISIRDIKSFEIIKIRQLKHKNCEIKMVVKE